MAARAGGGGAGGSSVYWSTGGSRGLAAEGTVPAAFPQTKPVTGEERGPSKRSLSGRILSSRANGGGVDTAVRQQQHAVAYETAAAGENGGVSGVPDARTVLENVAMPKRIRAAGAEGGGSDVGAVKTFTQLGTMARRAAGADHAGVDVVDALRRVTSTSMLPRNAVNSGVDIDDDEENENGGDAAPGFRAPPLDWGMKVSMRVTSPSPASFAWAVSMHSRVEAKAVHQFASASPSHGNPSADCASVLERDGKIGGAYTTSSSSSATPDAHAMQAFRAATMSWIHPAEQFSGSVLAAMHSESAPSGGSETHLAARRQAWRRSFHSLFASLRAEKAPMFVLQCAECAAIFLGERYHEKVRGQKAKGPCVMLAHQRPGIRQALESSGVEMQVLDTATPAQQKVDARSLPHFDTTGHLSQGHAMDTERREDEEADDIEDDEDAANALDARFTRKVSNGIVFAVGVLDVNAVFDVALNFLASHNVREDVPQLLSPTPFVGATLASASVRCGSVKRAGSDGSMENLELLEVSGTLPPWVVQRVARSIEGACTSFEVVLRASNASITPQLNTGFARLRNADGARVDCENSREDEENLDAFAEACTLCVAGNNVEDATRAKELVSVSWNGTSYTSKHM